MALYVQKNEETSYLKIVHFYDEEKGVPPELEANSKSKSYHKIPTTKLSSYILVLNKAFPELTIDLVCSLFSSRTPTVSSSTFRRF